MRQVIRYIPEKEVENISDSLGRFCGLIMSISGELRGEFAGNKITNSGMPFVAWSLVKAGELGLQDFGLREFPGHYLASIIAKTIILSGKLGVWCVWFNGELAVVHTSSWLNLHAVFSAASACGESSWEKTCQMFDWEQTDDFYKLWGLECITELREE